MPLPDRMKFGIFMAPFHPLGENPTLGLERDFQTLQWLDDLGFDEAWIGEHHSAGWETIASPEVFIAAAAERTKNIKLGTGVVSLPYHHPLMVANRMVLLDHLTRGRVMLGVGPGALVTDAYMLGIDPGTQRRRMDESLGIIMRLLNEAEPVTHESEWFTLKEARLHLRPFTRPRFPIAVAASQSPSGVTLAGKHGAALLTLNVIRGDGVTNKLSEFWQIAEDSAAEHGKTMDRSEWRIVQHVHLADSRDEAIKQVRTRAGEYQRGYFEKTLGHDPLVEGPQDKIVEGMIESGAWCVGTPDDLISKIEALDEETGGFGGILVQANEWGTREQVFHSYELLARYVMPRFQGSLESLTASQAWSADKRDELNAARHQAMEKAKHDYVARHS